MLDLIIDKTRVRYCREMARKAFAECATLFPDGFPANMEQAVTRVLPGFHLFELEHLPDDVAAIVSLEDRAIGANIRHAPVNRRFSVAHEIGHVRLHHPHDVFEHTGRHDANLEAEADIFAAEFLVPLPSLKRAFRNVSRDPEVLARTFDVSREVMFHRYKDAGLLCQIL